MSPGSAPRNLHISDRESQTRLRAALRRGKSGFACLGALKKKHVNIFVRVWMRKEASGGDNGRQEATGKGVKVKNGEKWVYNRRVQEVGR